jgi:hypothetical protein
VATALGAPSRVFYKAEDKMKIHSPNAHRRVAARRSDFFYNYFTLGMVCLSCFLRVVPENTQRALQPPAVTNVYIPTAYQN